VVSKTARPVAFDARLLGRPYPCGVSILLAPRYWGAHLLMVAAVAAAVLLGLWQLHVWEAARAHEARDLSNARPLPLADVMIGDSPFNGRYLGQPVSFSGEWLSKGTLYVSNRDLDGRRGYWVVTPVLVGGSAMPVVRGWSAQPAAPVPSGRVQVTGWLQASEGAGAPDDDPHDDVIPEMRIASIVEHVDADLYSGYVVAKHSAGASRTSAFQDLSAVTPDSVPKVSNVTSLRNLLYAFQWWIFGVFALYIWTRWCRDTWEQLNPSEQVASEA
jgi:cytochrome oxidase assembly protein ShyY1